MALEHKDDFECTRRQLAETTECAVEKVRAACATAAHEKVAAVGREVIAKDAEASVDLIISRPTIRSGFIRLAGRLPQ